MSTTPDQGNAVREAASCSACGGSRLEAHFSVAGGMGGEGLIPTTDRFGTALSDIVRCGDCGHMQLAEFPREEVLEEAYADAESDDYLLEESGQRETARRVLARIERHASPGRLADLGCWVGFLPAEAKSRGWAAVGVEPSGFAAAYARERLGVDVIQAPLLDAGLERDSFDAVFMGDVIEHLIDPATALERVREILKENGLLAMTLPDAGSRAARVMGANWWSVIPTHVQYFTRSSLATLLRHAGFAPLTVSTAPKVFSVEYYLRRVGGYSDPLAGVLVGLARRAGLADRMWAPDLRDRMLMIARKEPWT
jgi:SAM-dependent methyltransferase